MSAHSVFYDVYMRSSLWRARRWFWWFFSDRRCEGCRCRLVLHRRDLPMPVYAGQSCEVGRGGQVERVRVLTVHHVTYRRLGRERREDVQLLCWRCHQLAQARPLTSIARVINGRLL